MNLKLPLFLFFLSFSIWLNSQNLRLLTYNIRFDNPSDGENRWENRRDFLCKQIKFYEPDVLGTQEGLVHQLNFMDSVLDNYKYIGMGRDDGRFKGEFCAIFYNTNTLKLVSYSSFWLSTTPDTVSLGWDAALPRICTWAIFVHQKTKQRFMVFNTHFDHVGKQARVNSARLILEKIHSMNYNKLPVILLGDFNLEPESEAIQYISSVLVDAKSHAVGVIFGPEGTFNGFDLCSQAKPRIDYIFVEKKSFNVLKYAVLSDSFQGRCPSDHFPVYVEMEFSKRKQK
jgi:endonuclease/exonuclease/phosphatase family metal-dependent hydrolase